MQVRILDPGFAGFTGFFGTIKFENGVSEHISGAEAERLGCIVAIEDMEGHNPSATQRMVDTHKHNLDELLARGQGVSGASAVDQKPVNVAAVATKGQPSAVAGLNYAFSREDLEDLADKEGIAGLRAFAGSYAIKGRAIAEIIDELLALKAAAESVQE